MNIVFFGSSEFSVPSLKALLASRHNISSVITQPDRAQGRGLVLSATAVKTVAEGAKLKIYQSSDINKSEAVNFLKDLNADLFVVIAYGQILSPEILQIPQKFCINVHASLLPKYRGAAPINWAIIKGEKQTGITIIKMTPKMDTGPIILQKILEIKDTDTSITLEDRLSQTAAQLLLNSLNLIENNNYNLVVQDEEKATFAPKLQKQNGLINWSKSAQDIYNLIRGCLPWPGAFTYYKGKLLKIYKARVSSRVLEFVGSSGGEIINISKEGIVVATGKDNLVIEELQIEGKRRMKTEEFIAGHKICAGEILGLKK